MQFVPSLLRFIVLLKAYNLFHVSSYLYPENSIISWQHLDLRSLRDNLHKIYLISGCLFLKYCL